VLKSLGETWIDGYKPGFNYQRSLETAVVRWLDTHPDWFQKLPSWQDMPGLAEANALWIGPPPTHSNAAPPDELEQTMAVARRYNVAERDARNHALGRAGEQLALHHERQSLITAGRSDLARKVRWISDEEGDGSERRRSDPRLGHFHA